MKNYNKSFHYLWIGQALANAGDVFYIVALMDIIYRATQSATFMALVPFTITFSQFISGLLAPLMFDKFTLKRILAISQFAKTIILGIVGLLIYLSFDASFLFIIYIAISCIAFLDGWALPSRNSMIPRLVQENQLTKANGFLSIVDQTIRLSGWAVGGIFVAFLGGNLLLSFVILLFVISTLFMLLINDHHKETPSKSDKNKMDSLKEGWSTILNTPKLKTISVMNVAEGVASGVWIAAILYIYIEQALQVGEQWWGFINSTFFLGLMFGGIVTFRFSKTIDNHIGNTIIIGSFLSFSITFVFGVISLPWLALLLSLLFGVFSQMKDVAQNTLFQKSCTLQTLPKVYSAQGVIFSLTFGLSTLLLGSLTDLFGVRFTFLFSSLLLLVSTLYAIYKREEIKNAKGVYHVHKLSNSID